ncbi:MAG: hypothetical protein LBK12_02385, partial [Odoribacteraceae bacterium]|nr:hypothetical protein [Odoribacteraceae bacterium]
MRNSPVENFLPGNGEKITRNHYLRLVHQDTITKIKRDEKTVFVDDVPAATCRPFGATARADNASTKIFAVEAPQL